MADTLSDIEEADGAAFLERNLQPMSFPALEKVYCAGFAPILDYIAAPSINDLEVEAFSCEVMEWKRFHFQNLSSSTERLTLCFMELQTPTYVMYPKSYMNLTWLRLHHVGIVSPVHPWVLLPNLQILSLEKHQQTTDIIWETELTLDHVLSRGGIFGPLDNLRHLTIKSMCLSGEESRSLPGFYQLYYHKELTSLHIQSCTLPAGLMALLLDSGTEDRFLGELRELSLMDCECDYSIPDLKTLLATNRPQLSLTGSLRPSPAASQ